MTDLDVIAEKLVNHLTSRVADGTVPDQLRYLDAAQALRIAQVLAPAVLEIIDAVVPVVAAKQTQAVIDTIANINFEEI